MKTIKKTICLMLSLTFCIGALQAVAIQAFAATNDMFFDLAFGISQSGHIEAGSNNFYKFTVNEYTTFTIDLSSIDENWGVYDNGGIKVIKEKDYNNMVLGKEYKVYYSAEKIRGSSAENVGTNFWFEGNMSLYEGTYYLMLFTATDSMAKRGSSNYTITVTPTVTTITKINYTSTSNYVTLTWVGDLGATKYQLQKKTGNKYRTLSTTISTTYTDKRLTAGTTYSYRVRGVVNVGNKDFYGEWKTINTTTKPSVPSINSLTTGSNHRITIRWEPVENCSGYQIQIATNNKFKSVVSTKNISGATQTSYTFPNLQEGKTYYLRIRSFKMANDVKHYSAWSSSKLIACK